jgi:hypothetical protein
MQKNILGIKVIATFIPIYIIERVGRKKLLIGSMIIVILSSLALGGTFLLINKKSADVIQPPNDTWTDSNVTYFRKCAKYR